MKPQSVLLTTDTSGGVWNFSLELARDLQPQDIEVHLATMGKPLDRAQRAMARELDNVTIHESSFRLEWMKDPWKDVDEAGTWLLDLEQSLQPDLIHLNSYSLGDLDWHAPVLITAHSCVYTWHEAVRGRAPSATTWGTYHTRVKEGLRRAGFVTAPTQSMLDALRRIYGPFKAAKPVPNCRSSAEFHAKHREPLILAAGRLWDEGKNFRVLDAAASGVDWPIYIAGEDRHPDGGAVHFPGLNHLGHLPELELAQWMGRASIFVHPALYEPFGLAPLEAALAGCCLILSDIPTLREIWDGAALFVPPNDVTATHKAMQHLITHYMHRQRLRDRAHERALQFSPERTVDGYLDLYSTLLQGALQPVAA